MSYLSLNNWPMAKKLIFGCVSAGLVAAIAVGTGAYVVSASAMRQAAKEQLDETTRGAKQGLRVYFDSVVADFEYLANTDATKRALVEFTSAYAKETPDLLRRAYIEDNPHPIGSKHLLDAAPGDSEYSKVHAARHDDYRTFLEAGGYYDIFLISTAGDIVYSVYKEVDFATNLRDGAYAETGLARVAAEALAAEAGSLSFADFEGYAPSAGAPAAFIATSVVDDAGAVLGVLAKQIPADRIAAAVATGTSTLNYVVGSDGLLRTDLSATDENDILVRQIEGAFVDDAAHDVASATLTTGVLGEEVIVSVSPHDVLGQRWIVVAEKPVAAAFAALTTVRNTVLMIVLPTILLVSIGGYAFGRRIAHAIVELAQRMRQIADGWFDVEIVGAERADEIGDMAKALEILRTNSIAARDAAAEREATQEAAEKRAEEMSKLQSDIGDVVDAAVAGDFTRRVDTELSIEAFQRLAAGVNSVMQAVDDGVGAVDRVIGSMADGDLDNRMTGDFTGSFAKLQTNVNETIDRLRDLVADLKATTTSIARVSNGIAGGAADLAMRAENQASSLEETAATMEEMSATVQANAESATRANEFAVAASGRAVRGVEVVADAVEAMGQIETSSGRISDIISVIEGIAFQTNLLALNAAVEAARAGDAGKGFAVVASEVRTLAQRSSEAAKDITALIQESSSQVSDGVELVRRTGEALETITESIGLVETSTSAITNASQEQATGVSEISSALSHMDETTQKNSSIAEESAAEARQLAGETERLTAIVSFFKINESLIDESLADKQWEAKAAAR